MRDGTVVRLKRDKRAAAIERGHRHTKAGMFVRHAVTVAGSDALVSRNNGPKALRSIHVVGQRVGTAKSQPGIARRRTADTRGVRPKAAGWRGTCRSIEVELHPRYVLIAPLKSVRRGGRRPVVEHLFEEASLECRGCGKRRVNDLPAIRVGV